MKIAKAISSLSAVLLGVASFAGSAAAQVACGGEIGPGQQVVLGEHLRCDDVAAAVVVRGPAVLDLDGFSITCADADADGVVPKVGILIVGTGVTVRNGAVDACHNGVVVAGSGRHRLDDVAALSGSGDGIVLASDGNHVSEALAFFHGGSGFAIQGRGNVVTDSDATGNRVGFRVAARGTLARNFASANERDGFLIGGSGSHLSDNRAIGSMVGFTVVGGQNRLVRNEGSQNLIGIFLDRRATGNALLANVTSRNTAAGIVTSGERNRLLLNRAEENVAHGVRVTPTARTTAISGTVARGNGVNDLVDETPGCGANRWRNNRFETRNQDCVE
jgi:hypothetical protein